MCFAGDDDASSNLIWSLKEFDYIFPLNPSYLSVIPFTHHSKLKPLQFLFKPSMTFMSSSLISKSNSWKRQNSQAAHILCKTSWRWTSNNTCLAKECIKNDILCLRIALLYLEILFDPVGCYWLCNDNHVPLDVEPDENLLGQFVALS